MLGCQASRPPDPISQAALPIVGGTEASTCQWPSAVMIVGSWVCTGTLVHPRAVVTAKHCLMNEKKTAMLTPSMVGFGESRSQWAKTVNVSRCFVHPTNDIGLCLLAEDVTDLPIVPVMAPCEATLLQPGRPIVEVGFGVVGAHDTTYGTKKWINGTIEHRSEDQSDILVTTGTQDGEYFGDSGGPLFFKMPDQTWRLVGEDCCSDDIVDAGPRISTYTSVPYHVDWLEEQSGLDLTPCHDPGGWNPDERCTGFPTNPEVGVGTWANLCQGQTVVRSQTCADSPRDAGADGDARDTDGLDATPEAARDARMRDGDADDDAPDARLAGGVDLRRDVVDQDAAWPGMDTAAAAIDSPTDPIAPSDDAFAADAAPASNDARADDAGTMATDAGARDLQLAPTDGATDAHADAGRWPDGATDREIPFAGGGGCACSSGAIRPRNEWLGMFAVGLVLATGRWMRRRRSQR
jgi:hypothetical protein